MAGTAMKTPHVFVIHVRGDTIREAHITDELKRHGIDFEFVSDGNIQDLSPDILRDFFDAPLKNDLPATSCAYKHLLAYKKILDGNIPYALILEDDIELSGSCEDAFNKSIVEAQALRLKGYLISYESSGHKYVVRSERRPGKTLYRKPHGRCAGAYLIDACAAEKILQYTIAKKCRQPIDWHHNELADKGLWKFTGAIRQLPSSKAITANFLHCSTEKNGGCSAGSAFRCRRPIGVLSYLYSNPRRPGYIRRFYHSSFLPQIPRTARKSAGSPHREMVSLPWGVGSAE